MSHPRVYAPLPLLLLVAACPPPPVPPVQPTARPVAPAAPAGPPVTAEEPFHRPGATRPPGTPPFRLAVVADPPATAELTRLVQVLRANLERGGDFVLGGGGASLRVGPRAATLYIPAGLPGGPAERSFRLDRQDPASRARELASALHDFYLGRPGLYYTRIAFVAGTGADRRARHVFVMSFDGSGILRVSDENQPNLMPDWSPSGDLIYTAFVDGAPLLVLRPSGPGAPRLLARERTLNTGAAFSPDGRSIAVSQSVDGNTDIYLVDRSGAVRRRLTRHPGIDISPSWSPEGAELAFVSDREGSPQIFVLSLRSGSIRRLTSKGFYNQEPDWCPLRGSRRIAYTHRYPGSRYEVHLLDGDTGRSTRLTTDGGRNTGPSWSPDCSMLLYTAKGSGLWAVSPDGRSRRQLYAGRARSPAWSPRLPPF